MRHIAILGCGQLARLLALAGQSLGIRFTFVALGKGPTSCVESLGKVIPWDPQRSAMETIIAIGDVDAICPEHECIDSILMQAVDKTGLLRPTADIMLTCKNRLAEKKALENLDIFLTPYVYVPTVESMLKAVDKFGYPLVFKKLERSFDGVDQYLVRNAEELNALVGQYDGFGWVAEPHVDVVAEISMISARSLNGEVAFYPLTESEHIDNVLQSTLAPADFVDIQWHVRAQREVRNLMTAWQYVGVMVTEFFLTESGLILNKVSPRVHSCGNWTQMGAQTCQFENHLRAVLGMKLGSPNEYGFTGSVNIVGGMNHGISLPGVEVQMYNKNKDDIPGQVLGHANLIGAQREEVMSQMKLTNALLRSA